MNVQLTTACLLAGLMTAIPPAEAFDLQGHRGARGLMPENTLPAFAAALAIGVTTLELDLAMTSDNVLVVSHDPKLNPDITRGADGTFLTKPGPAIRALTFDEVQRYDVGRLKPGTSYANSFPEQKPVDGARIPALAELFALVRHAGADHVRFNIETKLTPTSGEDTPEPEAFARAVATAIRLAGLESRVTVQSFDWRTLAALGRIAPDIARSCITTQRTGFDNIERGRPGPSPWTAGLDVDQHGGSTPRLVKAAGCAIWSPAFRDLTPEWRAEAKSLGLQVIPWTVNARADMDRLIEMGVDGLITDYPDRLRAGLSARGITVPPSIAAR